VTKKLDYHTSVNYSQADPAKILAQQEGLATAKNMPRGFKELAGTRGESAYVFDMGDMYGALVQEGLGTKSLIAQAVYQKTGISHFAAVAQDTVACIINDLVSVGARPIVLNAYWSASSYEWLTDKHLATDFIKGWRQACDAAGVVWGGGETQSLKGIVTPGALEFAGSAFGVINDKQQVVQGKNLRAGDAIVLIESSGVHANGISLIRELADGLPAGYGTKLADGSSFGETALIPTPLYARLIQTLQEAAIPIHYLSNITGHGWRKLMRAEVDFTYRLHTTPPVADIFNFIAEQSGNSLRDMYGTFNMGAGFAIYVPAEHASAVINLAAKQNLKAWQAGVVEQGPKQVIIEPHDITFASDTLEVR
jgi:phosphoribosylformylglycinamidine cyclo-ligase